MEIKHNSTIRIENIKNNTVHDNKTWQYYRRELVRRQGRVIDVEPDRVYRTEGDFE